MQHLSVKTCAAVLLLGIVVGAGLWLMRGPFLIIHAQLADAEKALRGVSQPEDLASDAVLSFLNEYIASINSADKTFAVLSPAQKEALAPRLFRRIAGHQLVLQALTRRLDAAPESAIAKARYENMQAQKHVAGSIEGYAAPAQSETARQLLCAGCNVIVISLTTLRKDHIGLYGYDKPTTPNIDSFFQGSLQFTNTLATSAWTIPDALSWQTALFPYTHGVVVRGNVASDLVYNDSVLTLAQVLSSAGYRTAAFTGGGDYNARLSGLARGFDLYLDETNYEEYGVRGDLSLGGGSLEYAPLGSFVDLASEWLEKNADEKFFLFVQGYDTHCPYTPHAPYAVRFTAGAKSDLDYSICYTTHDTAEAIEKDGETYWNVDASFRAAPSKEVRFSEDDRRYMTALYDARIAEADANLESLFTTIRDLGLEKNTIVILMSEHGEMLGENGWFMRGGSVRGTSYQPALNFPLLVKHPTVHSPIIVDDLVQTVDILPTILSLLQVSDPQGSIREGAPLSLSLFGDEPNTYAYAASLFIPAASSRSFSSPTTAEVVRSRDWKLIKNTFFTEFGLRPESVAYELYDLKGDPYEKTDLYDAEPERAGEMVRALDAWLSSHAESLSL